MTTAKLQEMPTSCLLIKQMFQKMIYIQAKQVHKNEKCSWIYRVSGKTVPTWFQIGNNSYLNAAIETSKTIFEILMKRAFCRAQEFYDSMQNWLRKLHLKFPSQLIKLWKNWRKKIEWIQLPIISIILYFFIFNLETLKRERKSWSRPFKRICI